ncbi:substrate-binding domain-containing protein [Paenibacillus sp. LMG 31456]|uniref:Substrate-binding domain-containing protein n=1 Tax=Paenibacillus foliorum TaxID=2654974 RepID=A0A972GLM8_9BACL|nr:GntR family transcriptional regulator [Paenibacillus foliorum]NOU92982.1 substrate-binding domain-containing protein [Paenibacillus foliorum]
MKSKYVMVKDEIKSWILQGKVSPHEKIGTENDIMEIFDVSRHTVRQAIGDLEKEGWIYRWQGKGTFCADQSKRSKSHSYKTIGVITTYISEYIFSSIIRGIESYLSSTDYMFILTSTNNNIEKEKKCIDSILARNVDAIIVEPTKSAIYNPNINYYLNMETNNIPYVMLNALYPQLQAPSLTMDEEQGGYIATEHLIQLGHKKIIGIFKADDLQGVNRMNGFIRAHRAHNVPIIPGLIISYNTEDPREKIQNEIIHLFNNHKYDITAIFSYNDAIALYIINFFRELNINVPEDVSVVGYDDSYLAEMSEVKLTSVIHPKRTMGLDAAKLIVDLIEGKQQGSQLQSVIYKPELVVRTSTATAKT